MRACFEEEALGQTQDSLQRLYLSGLETTWSSSKLAGGGSQGEVWAAVWLCLGCHTCDPNSDNWQEMVKQLKRWMDGWMMDENCLKEGGAREQILDSR